MTNMKKVAMWSGPRNISTALMRSFENRSDTAVSDEPFYSFFLKQTKIKHPIYKEVIENYDSSWDSVAKTLIGPNPNNKNIWYQKLMTHHWVDNQSLEWTKNLSNCFLIRNPEEVIISYLKIHKDVNPALIGLPQQLYILNYIINKTKKNPIVISSEDILKNPKLMLKKLCNLLEIPFLNQMLEWPKGPRDSDGIWGEYWYKNVIETTSFSKPKQKKEELPDDFHALLDECMGYYKQMEKYKINLT